MQRPLRLVFMGTAALACPALEALAKSGAFALGAVVTQPDRPKGRELRLQPPPVKAAALKLGLPVLQPPRARQPEFLDTLRGLAPDLIVVVAYGQILPPALVHLPRWGCVNVHTSLLPKYRGAAPIQWALLNGDTVTGVTLMKIDEGLDTGDILAQCQARIGDRESAVELHDRLAALGARLLLDTLSPYVEGRITPRPQPTEGVSLAPKIRREDGLADWSLSARELFNRLRAFVPWPGLFTYLPGPGQPLLLKLWEAEPVDHLNGPPGAVLAGGTGTLTIACGAGALVVRSVQPQNGRRMGAREFLAGHPLQPGTRLGPGEPPAASAATLRAP